MVKENDRFFGAIKIAAKILLFFDIHKKLRKKMMKNACMFAGMKNFSYLCAVF
jgi:hypothetical protein